MKLTAMIDTPAGISGAEPSQSRTLDEVEAPTYDAGKAQLGAQTPEGFQVLWVRVTDRG